MSRADSLRKYIVATLVSGILVVAPIYLALLLLLKAMSSVRQLLQPVTKVLPLPVWLPIGLVALVAVLLLCFAIGVLISTSIGRSAQNSLERHLFKKIPGYWTIRGFTQRLLGHSEDQSWKPALAEIEDALVPAFIIEELDDELITIFVPSVPTPFAGTVYVISAARVHPANIPFGHAIRVLSQWGGGSGAFVAALENPAACHLLLPASKPLH
jgi:uncharacterized membrane protein